MAVYMIQAGDDRGPVKIGHGDDPQFRLRHLQTGHHMELRIIRLLDGGVEQEAVLHERFSALHIRGEWFSFSKEMLGDLGMTPLDAPTPQVVKPRPVAGTHASFIDLLGGPGPISEALGCAYNRVLKWKIRNRIPADVWNNLASMAAALSVDLTADDLARSLHEASMVRAA